MVEYRFELSNTVIVDKPQLVIPFCEVNRGKTLFDNSITWGATIKPPN